MSDKKAKPNQQFIYCGDGLGVPGLPHNVTHEQAENLGHLGDFEAALNRGDYRPERAETPEKSED